MIVIRNTSIFAILLLANIHEGIQTPLDPLGEDSPIYPSGDDEIGSLTDDDFLKALSPNFVNNEPDQGKNRDTDTFEGDILGDKDELMAARAVQTPGDIN